MNNYLYNKLLDMQADEAKAPGDYQTIINEIPNLKDKKILMKILKDERRHFKIVSKLRKKYSR